MKYIFETTATMKEYNCKKWWIDEKIVPTIRISTENLKNALQEYCKQVYKKSCIEISNNALKNKRAMYVDTQDGIKQVGYVLTGKSEFKDDINYRWSTQYINLWVNITTVIDTNFDEE